MSVNVNVNGTLGVLLIGYAIMLFFYGLTAAQMAVYFRTNKADLMYIKIAVLALWIIDNVHAVFTSAGVYTYLIRLHGNEHGVDMHLWMIAVMIYASGISNMLSRSLFAHRIWRLNNGRFVLPLIVMVLSLVALVTGMIYAVIVTRSMLSIELLAVNRCAYVGNAAEILADIIIAFTSFRLLSRLRSGLSRPHSVLQASMVLSIGTGLLTSLCVIMSLAMFIALPRTFAGLAWYSVISKDAARHNRY
ncbi:hypothetical protein OBBRIDRAFT_798437 [Obba rivulosa]|uniref:DUF6534 domain-containing protein n=1 Tax=Obba rivulosa TaxID=1052685 RepID=A0A8E2AKS6_9APHY|nr:hypothetical protein OBBRIDRAFT_798437 [Obba rivulosa]